MQFELANFSSRIRHDERVGCNGHDRNRKTKFRARDISIQVDDDDGHPSPHPTRENAKNTIPRSTSTVEYAVRASGAKKQKDCAPQAPQERFLVNPRSNLIMMDLDSMHAPEKQTSAGSVVALPGID